MGALFELLTVLLLTLFFVAWCSDQGLRGEINGEPFCIKIGGECSPKEKP